MAFAAEQAISIIILVSALYLLIRNFQHLMSPLVTCVLLTFLFYLVFGTLFYDDINTSSPLGRYVRGYLGSLLIILALTSFILANADDRKIIRYLGFVRNCLIIAAVSVYLSPILYQKVFVTLPPTDLNRFGGVFGNPNEAGIVACLAVVFAWHVPFKFKLLQLLALLITAGAVVLTFSKTAMSFIILMLIFIMMRSFKKYLIISVPAILITLVFFIQYSEEIFNTIADQNYVELTENQQNRIRTVGKIISGNIDEDTTTGRTIIWKIGFDRFLENFPKPGGLGSFHSLVGGARAASGEWAGVHNTYLMMFGEGGLLAGAMLVLTMVSLLWSSWRHEGIHLEFFCWIAIAADMFANHHALLFRYLDFMFGIMLGLTVYSVRKRKLARALTSIPNPDIKHQMA